MTSAWDGDARHRRSGRRPVLVGVDDTEESANAVAYGAWEARRRRVPLRLITALDSAPAWVTSEAIFTTEQTAPRSEHDLLAAAASRALDCQPDIDIDGDLITGRPAAVLTEASAAAGLVVLGPQASDGIVGHLSGSIAAQAAAHAAAPVVVMRPSPSAVGDPGWFMGRPVVVGVDGSEASYHAVALAVDEALARRAPLHAVYAWSNLDVHDIGPIPPDSFYEADVRAKAERLLSEAMSGWRQRYPELMVVLRAVHAVNALIAVVRESADAGLVVVGSRGNGGFLGLRLGSTVDGLIRRATVPVAVVHGAYPEQL